MKLFTYLSVACASIAAAASTQGILDLVERRLPEGAGYFLFSLRDNQTYSQKSDQPPNDEFSVYNDNGKIHVEGTSFIALAVGLHRYLTDVAHVDISWFIGSRLHLAPLPLALPTKTINGSSTVPWRYHFNTAFWSWEDWELQLDWMALRGINLPLAWVGIEKILLEVFFEIGLDHDEIFDFFSGPAFQSWNRFGNIQDSWGGELSQAWIDNQFELQKKIVCRMVELGMTPVLPAFTGFVPRALSRVFPNATVVNGSQWNEFSPQYTNDTFLEPQDELFGKLQNKVISKQLSYYGNVTHIFTLDQYNENDPASGDLDYLRNVTQNTWRSLKAADPEAIWMLQGWLFFSNKEFWTAERVESYLSGVEDDSDMLILDLFSETQPQWQRLDSYYGKPWIFCELHDYGGNMGLYGQVENITIGPIQALEQSRSMVGMGLTMEGQEGNEVVYDLLLDQAWFLQPIDTTEYFSNFARARYGPSDVPNQVIMAWDILLHTVYNNTNLTVQAVTKSPFELPPDGTGLVSRIAHHPTVIPYNTTDLVRAWALFLSAAVEDPDLWHNEAYTFDLADFSRQVLANTFPKLYELFVNATTPNGTAAATQIGDRILSLLYTLDDLMSAAHPSFHLSTWEASARAWTPKNFTNTTQAQAASDFLAYNARNQVTLWGPKGEITDYASKSWSGLLGPYYAKCWAIWIDEYKQHGSRGVNQSMLHEKLLKFEEGWVKRGLIGLEDVPGKRKVTDLRGMVNKIKLEWSDELGL